MSLKHVKLFDLHLNLFFLMVLFVSCPWLLLTDLLFNLTLKSFS